MGLRSLCIMLIYLHGTVGLEFKEVISIQNGTKTLKNQSDSLYKLLLQSSLRHVAILSNSEPETNDLVTMVTEMTTTSTVFAEIEEFVFALTSMVKTLLKTQSIDRMREQLNLLLICDVDCLNTVIRNAHSLDISVGKGCVFRHFSKWILIPATGNVDAITTSNITFDNVNMLSQEMGILWLDWGLQGRAWRILDERFTSIGDTFPNLRYGLNGRTLRVASLEWLPYTKRQIVNGQLVYVGVSGEVLNRLSQVFNFSIEYMEPADQLWGYKVNATWNGIVGMLQRGAADMCSVPYAMNIERSRVITYTYPIMYDYHSAVYKKSEEGRQHWTVLLSCFKWEVYMYGFIVLFVVLLLFVFFERTDPSRDDTYPRGLMKTLDAAIQSIAVPLHHGTENSSKLISSKVLLSFWWLFCIVITSVYTGNLIAFLTVTKENIPFQTLEDIARQEEYEVGVMSGSYLELILQSSKNDLLQTLWGRIEQSRVSGNSDTEFQAYISKLYNGKLIFMSSQMSFDTFKDNSCHLATIPESFMPIYSSMIFPKYSPLSELFTSELVDMTESGLIDTWYHNWLPNEKTCAEKTTKDKFQLKLSDLYSALVACVAGTLLALSALIFEYLCRCNKDVR